MSSLLFPPFRCLNPHFPLFFFCFGGLTADSVSKVGDVVELLSEPSEQGGAMRSYQIRIMLIYHGE